MMSPCVNIKSHIPATVKQRSSFYNYSIEDEGFPLGSGVKVTITLICDMYWGVGMGRSIKIREVSDGHGFTKLVQPATLLHTLEEVCRKLQIVLTCILFIVFILVILYSWKRSCTL